MLKKRTVLFSDKYGWSKDICSELNAWRYAPFFRSFSDVNLDEFDILIPQHLSDIQFVREHYPELHGKKCFIPSLEAINICNDKLMFNAYMTTHGYGDLIPHVRDRLPFPYILKKRIDEHGVHCRIITTRAEEQLFQKFIVSEQYFKQQYVTGQDECTTHILMVGGKAVFHRTIRFSFSEKMFVKGVGCKPMTRKKFRNTPYIDVFESMLNKLEFEGICCFNYKIDNGGIKIFEVNPRYGGSMTRFLPAMIKVYTSRLTGVR